LEGTLQAGTSAVSDKLLDLVGLGGKSAADKGKDTRDYLAAAFPELNAWERAGADASSAGMVDAGFENQKELTKMQLDNQKEIAEMQNETQKEIAGIQSATSLQNTKDQVYAQNEMLAYQQKESTARVASIMENTNLSKHAAYANLHTDQERDYFMQRYHDVISSFGGKTSYDADNRPLLVMRSNLWASGYDVDGTDQTS